MAERGQTLEDRVIARLLDIFPDRDAEAIRNAVYGALAKLNRDNIVEEALLDVCIDGLLVPATPANAAGIKRRVDDGDTPDIDGTKRSRHGGGDGSYLDSSVDGTPNQSSVGDGNHHSESFNNDSIAGGVPIPVNPEVEQRLRQEQEARVRREQDVKMIIEMFPWIDTTWVNEQVQKPDFNAGHLVEYILTDQNAVPKKQKARPPPISDGATSSQTTAAPQTPRDYLNDYPLSPKSSNLSYNATQWLASQFQWLYMDSVAGILSMFNYHLPPAYKVLYEATKNVDLRNLKEIPVTIVRPGQPDVVQRVKIRKTRRNERRSIAPGLQDDIDWINKHIVQGEPVQQTATPDSASSTATTSSDVAMTSMAMPSDEELKLERAREQGDVYECGICCDECIISEQMIACADGHLFCIECLRRYAKEAIYGQTKTDLICMGDDCEARFPHDMVMKALDADNVRKLDEKRTFQAINTAGLENLEKCKHCGYACVIDVPPEVDKVFRCGMPECEREYCRICFVDWDEHMGKPCKEVETEDDTRKRREAEERMAAAVIRHCSKCKAPLIKEEGCNKLICSCGAIMCYICRETIRGYDHFCQHARDPQNPGCRLCKKCSLWEDPKLKDNVAVKEIQSEIKKQLADAGKDLKVGVEESPSRGNRQVANPMQQPPFGNMVQAAAANNAVAAVVQNVHNRLVQVRNRRAAAAAAQYQLAVNQPLLPGPLPAQHAPPAAPAQHRLAEIQRQQLLPGFNVQGPPAQAPAAEMPQPYPAPALYGRGARPRVYGAPVPAPVGYGQPNPNAPPPGMAGPGFNAQGMYGIPHQMGHGYYNAPMAYAQYPVQQPAQNDPLRNVNMQNNDGF